MIRINRPNAHNAVNSAVSSALGTALAAANADDSIRVVVLTGAGSSFCAGADLKELARGLRASSVHSPEHPDWHFGGIVRQWCNKPTIAAVNGHAMGGGLEIALACDLVVASNQARFAFPETSWGLYAAAGGAVRLHEFVGLRRSLEMLLTAEPIDASTALSWGLINRAVEAENVLDEALSLARRIAANGPNAVRLTKKTAYRAATDGSVWNEDWTGESAWDANEETTAAVFPSDEGIEGMAAFAEKRPPRWR
ncbi:enoyl-CoA hydratase/isomerase family protein [Arthrobacter sp. Z4-13]